MKYVVIKCVTCWCHCSREMHFIWYSVLMNDVIWFVDFRNITIMSISREDGSHSSPAVYNRFIERGSHKGKGLAVFTSGGDSQGIAVNFIFMV